MNTIHATIAANARPFIVEVDKAGKATKRFTAETQRTKRPLDSMGQSGRKAAANMGVLSSSLGTLTPQLSGVGTAITSLGTSFGGVGIAVTAGAVAFAAAGGAIARAGDQFNLVQARLQTLTGSAEQASATMQALFDLATDTGTSFKTLSDVTARFTLGLTDLGYGQQQIVDLSEAMVKMGALSGAGAQEFNNAMIQFSQSLASGEFRGEEFRSVAEQMPFVLKILARELGVTTGQLREMAHAGQLTAQVVVPALLDNLGEIRADFDSLPFTMGRGFTAAGAAGNELLVTMDKILGLSEAMSAGLLKVRDAFSVTNDFLNLLAPSLTERQALEAELFDLKNNLAEQLSFNPMGRGLLYHWLFGDSADETQNRIKEIEARLKELGNQGASISLSDSLPTISNGVSDEVRINAAKRYSKLQDEIFSKQLALMPLYERQRTLTQLWQAEQLTALDEIEQQEGAKARGIAIQRGKVNKIAAAELGKIQQAEAESLQQALKKSESEIERAQAEALSNATDWQSGLIRAQNAVREAANDNAKQMEKLYTNAFDGITESLIDMVITGKANFSDLAQSIIRDLIKIQLQQTVTAHLQGLLGSAASALGAGLFGGDITPALQNAGYSGDPAVYANGFHQGGIAGGTPTFTRSISSTLFDGAKRYHGGGMPGLRHDEVPAILQRGEGVFTQAQMRALAPVNDNKPPVVVNIINHAGVQVKQQERRTADGGIEVQVLLEAFDNDLAGKLERGEGATASVLENVYGQRRQGQ